MSIDVSKYDWAQWPPSGGSVPEADDKYASAVVPDAPPLDLEHVVGGVAAAYAAWSTELPADFDKVAAATPILTLKNIWRHPDAHPLVLTLLLLDKYGPDYIEWAPEVLRTTLRRDGVELSNSAYTKILAARVVLNSPSPWRQWEVFHWVCFGLAGEPPNFHYAEEPILGVLVAGYDAMRVVDPKRSTGLDVDKYVAACFRHEGSPYIPPPLHFAQRELEERKLRCKNCGALCRDDNDVRCVTCTSPDLVQVPYEYADLRDGVAALWKQRATLPLSRALQGLPDTPEGSVTAQLLSQWDYAKRVRANLVQQMKVIGG